jgi:NAD(P)-dependent dehydrogenase (short-subunit alcohol dehydrogenase family)
MVQSNSDTKETLAGKVALVTGGSRGIGRATCLALAERGAAIAVHYRAKAAGAEQVVATICNAGGSAAAFQADLNLRDTPGELVRQVMARLGPVDILVNNAGEMTDSSVADMTDELWDQAIALNLSSVFRCTRACIPSMKQRQWGRIINVSSQAVYTGSANHAHYAAAKAGLVGFTYSIAKELGTSGITANLVAPGRIMTDLLTERMTGREEEWLKQTPLRRFGLPEEVAEPIAFLASEAASYITGATIHVNGGLVMS